MTLMAFGLSRAFRPHSRSDRAGSPLWLSGGFRIAFEWPSCLSGDQRRRDSYVDIVALKPAVPAIATTYTTRLFEGMVLGVCLL